MPGVAAADGTWGAPAELTGVSSLGGQDPSIAGLACSSAGNCTAIGTYTDPSGNLQMFAVTETSGFWATAVHISTFSRIVNIPDLSLALSCASAGNCTAGSAVDGSGSAQAFVVSQVNGTWGAAQLVPGVSALSTEGEASVTGLSCKSAGNCTAGGFYFTSFFRSEAFVVTETNGTWGTAIQVPGTASLNIGAGKVTSVSCTAVGNCSAVGNYQAVLEFNQPFVINQRNGTWGTAQPVSIAGIGGANAEMTGGSPSQVHSIACASAGNCVLAGDYTDARFFEQAFLGNETGRFWRAAQAVPGIIAVNTAIAQTQAVSCVPGGTCTVAGIYSGQGASFHAWVIAQAAG